MEKFDLEKAKQGRQIVHKDGWTAIDWHYFNGTIFPVFIQWKGSKLGQGSVSWYSQDDPDIGLAPERVVEYVPFDGTEFYSGHETRERAINVQYGDVCIFKVSCNPDGSDPTIERVEESGEAITGECSGGTGKPYFGGTSA